MTASLGEERLGRVLVLTMDNPGARNALSPAVYAKGRTALEAAGKDPDVGAIVLRGAGEAFCAGGDLNRLNGNREKPRAEQRASTAALGAWVETIRTCPRPVIAAVEGAAAGAGFSLALACDLVVAARDAVFVMAYIKVGLTPDGGATVFLPRALPHQMASELVFEGGRIGADRLYALGVVNRVVEPGAAFAEAKDWATKLAEGPPEAMARAKRLLEAGYSTTFSAQLAIETDAFVDSVHAEEAGEGIAAFLERRKPRFTET
ncbi:MAG: enoyl-CoA hydratase [Rhodospirillales bacterium]|nr:enoyl-CoA hydratase [Rhodospirillales bacterium]MCW9039873.1 enoyl-CoA hydratase [Rhodospirillales bacterium]